MDRCPVSDAVRIPLAEDRRVFTPVARSSYRCQDFYDQRGAVERVNSRLAGGFGLSDRASAGWRRCSCHQHGADDHAGDGPRAHPGRPAREPAESGQTRLTSDRSPVTTRNQSHWLLSETGLS